ncbi:MAG: hypothetical protein IV097_05965 [Burkholderiaceae bacterium]|nr:hypothetical protein [Burkholderiaceae bacterium]
MSAPARIATAAHRSNVIPLQGCSLAPIAQRVRPGTKPKGIASLMVYRRRRLVEARKAESIQEEISTLRGVVFTCERVLADAHSRIAALALQQQEFGGAR